MASLQISGLGSRAAPAALLGRQGRFPASLDESWHRDRALGTADDGDSRFGAEGIPSQCQTLGQAFAKTGDPLTIVGKTTQDGLGSTRAVAVVPVT